MLKKMLAAAAAALGLTSAGGKPSGSMSTMRVGNSVLPVRVTGGGNFQPLARSPYSQAKQRRLARSRHR